jgi:hypothetical protein
MFRQFNPEGVKERVKIKMEKETLVEAEKKILEKIKNGS